MGAIVALAHLIRYMARADDVPIMLRQQERLYGAVQLAKIGLEEGSFAHQVIEFVASPTQDDGKPNLKVVRPTRA